MSDSLSMSWTKRGSSVSECYCGQIDPSSFEGLAVGGILLVYLASVDESHLEAQAGSCSCL